MPRTILIHLNVEVPDSDARDADDIADALLAAVKADANVRDLVVAAPLAESID